MSVTDDFVLDPLDGQSRLALGVFVLLAAVYLLSFGPFNSALAPYQSEWNAVTLLSSVSLIPVLAFAGQGSGGAQVGVVLWGSALALAALIAALSGLHWAALTKEPTYQWVNVAGVTTNQWLAENWKFTLMYLFFPLLLPLQFLVLRRAQLTTVIRAISVVFLVSIAVQWVQGLWDPRFLNQWVIGSGRYGGLASDPNAYAMSALLVAPLLIVGATLDRSTPWRVFLLSVSVLTFAGLGWAGNRTAVGGLGLTLALSPVILAVTRGALRLRLRILLLVSPLLFVGVGLWLVEYQRELIAGSGLMGQRVVQSWDKMQHGGLGDLLFKSEARGGLWLIGLALLWKSPLAGWGAGGFYREYPNAVFLDTGGIRAAFDSVLNHYLMIAVDFGLSALLLYLVLMLAPLVVGLLALRRLRTNGPRLVVVTLLVTQFVYLLGINTIPPAYFPDVVWLWTLQLGLLLVIGERVGVSAAKWLPAGRARTVVLGAAAAMVLATILGSYPVTFGSLGYRARLDTEGSPLRYDRNCYGVERQGETRRRWCARNARVKLPLPAEGPEEIVLSLSAGNPDLQQNPLKVRYGGPAGPTQELTLAAASSAEIHVPLDAGHVVALPKPDGKSVERFAVLSLDVSRTWVPKDWGLNDDPRELGILVQLPPGL